MTTLPRLRISTSKRLAGLEIPSAFAQATYAAAANAAERKTVSAKASRRRLTDKAMKLAATEALTNTSCAPVVARSAASWEALMTAGLTPAQALTTLDAAPMTVVLQTKGSASHEARVCESLRDASRIVTAWQDEQGLGASDLGCYHGQVSTDGIDSHRVAYNGRIFTVGGPGGGVEVSP